MALRVKAARGGSAKRLTQQGGSNMHEERWIAMFVGATLLIGVASCQPQGTQQQEAESVAVDTAAIMATFEDSLPAGFEAAVEAGDFDAQASIYAEDAVYSHPMAPPVRGRDSIRALLERVTPPGATADIESMDTGILGPDRVYDFGTVAFSFTPEGADEPQTITNTYFALFQRTDEGWKITHESLSLNHPPSEDQ